MSIEEAYQGDNAVQRPEFRLCQDALLENHIYCSVFQLEETLSRQSR